MECQVSYHILSRWRRLSTRRRKRSLLVKYTFWQQSIHHIFKSITYCVDDIHGCIYIYRNMCIPLPATHIHAQCKLHTHTHTHTCLTMVTDVQYSTVYMTDEWTSTKTCQVFLPELSIWLTLHWNDLKGLVWWPLFFLDFLNWQFSHLDRNLNCCLDDIFTDFHQFL